MILIAIIVGSIFISIALHNINDTLKKIKRKL